MQTKNISTDLSCLTSRDILFVPLDEREREDIFTLTDNNILLTQSFSLIIHT